MNKKIIIKSIFSIIILSLFIIGIFILLRSSKTIEKLKDIKEIKRIILSAGIWSYVVFVVLQFLQVTFIPLPCALTTIAGVIIFGPFSAFILSVFSVILGSIFAFIIGKIFGLKLLNWIFGKEKIEKMQKKMEKGKYAFFLMMLFPFFPDDILCLLSGVTNMDFKFFILTNLITRPIGIFCLCFVSTGIFIPFHGIGLVVWIVILIFIITLFILSIIFKDKIENIISNFKH